VAAVATIVLVDVTIVALSIGLHWRINFLFAELAVLAVAALLLRSRSRGLHATEPPGASVPLNMILVN
jgi:hypothetical protein